MYEDYVDATDKMIDCVHRLAAEVNFLRTNDTMGVYAGLDSGYVDKKKDSPYYAPYLEQLDRAALELSKVMGILHGHRIWIGKYRVPHGI